MTILTATLPFQSTPSSVPLFNSNLNHPFHLRQGSSYNHIIPPISSNSKKRGVIGQYASPSGADINLGVCHQTPALPSPPRPNNLWPNQTPSFIGQNDSPPEGYSPVGCHWYNKRGVNDFSPFFISWRHCRSYHGLVSTWDDTSYVTSAEYTWNCEGFLYPGSNGEEGGEIRKIRKMGCFASLPYWPPWPSRPPQTHPISAYWESKSMV